MIIKSMSRKEPSFDQLTAYMSSEKADGNYDLHHNCFGRSPEDIVREFHANSQLLKKRKNGNYLYHEIVSLQVRQGQDQQQIKNDLRDIVDLYVAARCPNNMVYGCLHEDHDHNLHYHLMMSANERGERTRLRLTQKQFDTVKRDLETHVLENYKHLGQRQLITADTTTEKMSVKAGEMKRRTGSMPIRDEIKQTIQEAMSQTHSFANFSFHLSERGYQFYTRGKNYGVDVQHEDGTSKKYRFSTLGIHDEYEAFQNALSSKQAAQIHSEAIRKAEVNKEQLDTPEEIHFIHEEETGETPDINTIDNETQMNADIDTKKEAFRESLKQIRDEQNEAETESNNTSNNTDEDNSSL